jgi:saccharopine dehydrogenase (NAD+, L-lysine-forming)
MDATLVLLGGYGGAGRALALPLLQETGARLVIAGRDVRKAEAFAQCLDVKHPGRVRWAGADASHPAQAAALLAPGDVLLDLTTAWEQAPALALAALDAGADFLDIHYQRASARALAPLDAPFRRAGRTLITQAGCHPGLPSAMLRAAAERLDRIHAARLGMALRFRVESLATALELVDEIGEGEGLTYRAGNWSEDASMLTLDLGPRFGKKTCYPMTMEELLGMPAQLGLQELSLRVAGFNPVADSLVLPLILLGARLRARRARLALARLLAWSVNAFTRGENAIAFSIDAEGERGGRPAKERLVVDAHDPYGLTAWPVAACLRQHLAQRFAPGLAYMGHAVEPAALLDDVARLGACVRWEPR